MASAHTPRRRKPIPRHACIGACASVLLAAQTAAALEVEVTSRGDNGWGFSASDDESFSLADCDEGVSVVFTVTYDDESTTDREL